MCTSSGERKIVICCHAPGGIWPARPTPAKMTLPSAGARMRSAPAGAWRSGSLKKSAMPTGSSKSHAPAVGRAARNARAGGTAPRATNGQPARSMNIGRHLRRQVQAVSVIKLRWRAWLVPHFWLFPFSFLTLQRSCRASPSHNGLDAIFERELLLLERTLLVLLLIGQVGETG